MLIYTLFPSEAEPIGAEADDALLAENVDNNADTHLQEGLFVI